MIIENKEIKEDRMIDKKDVVSWKFKKHIRVINNQN